MDTPKQILTAAIQNDAALDDLLAKYAGRLRGLKTQLVAFIRANRGADGKVAVALNSYNLLEQELARAGFASFYDYGDLFDQAGELALEQVADIPESQLILQASRQSLAAALSETTVDVNRQIQSLGNGIVQALKAEMEIATVIPRPLSGIAANISSATGLAEGRARTIVNTALASIQRGVHARALDSLVAQGVEMFLYYTGPLDGKTRPFCKPLVGKAIRQADTAKLSPGRGLTFRRNGGGWNCRHSSIPVTQGWIEANSVEVADSTDIARANAGAKR